ncbi:hypothetical protein [Aquicella lusitana]|nr:hypothetical protein [Aquicella lusitana]
MTNNDLLDALANLDLNKDKELIKIADFLARFFTVTVNFRGQQKLVANLRKEPCDQLGELLKGQTKQIQALLTILSLSTVQDRLAESFNIKVNAQLEFASFISSINTNQQANKFRS